MLLPRLSIQPSSVSRIDLQNSDRERSEAVVKTSTQTVHVDCHRHRLFGITRLVGSRRAAARQHDRFTAEPSLYTRFRR